MKPAAALLALAALAGCGGGGKDDALTVAGASSLTAPLTECAGDARLEFGGSDDLAAQIRQGVSIDVFAAANMALPQALADEGKAQKPVPFATNRLVLAVPLDSPIRTLDDLRQPITVVVGAESVPIGAYTRQVLARLPAAQRRAIEGAIRSEEPDVKGIVGKLISGAADAGFVYVTDVMAAHDLRAIALPDSAQPTVVYGISIVKPSESASAYVDGVLHGACAGALRKAGFGPPPK